MVKLDYELGNVVAHQEAIGTGNVVLINVGTRVDVTVPFDCNVVVLF